MLLLLTLVGCFLLNTEPEPVETDVPVDTDVEEATCGRIPPEGRCEDNVLVACVDGEKVKTDCGLFECGPGDDGINICIEPSLDDNPTPTDVDDLVSVFSGTVTTNRDGIAAFYVTAEEATSFLISATMEERGYLWVADLQDPSGRSVDLSDPVLTYAIFSDIHATLAWPSRAEDGPLDDGDWLVAIQVTDRQGYGMRDVDVAVDVMVKTDDDPNDGQLRVALVYTGMETVDPDLGVGVDLAIDAWRSIYDRYGIELIVDQFVAADYPLLMPQPSQDGDLWATLSAATDAVDILVVLAEDFADSDASLLGVAGGIPGTPTAGPRAGILVSWARHAGVNGEFNYDEVSFLATTLAHEVGHYTGLFHPVELDWESFDPLRDTPSTCDGETSCYRSLGDNLMFPASVCYGAGCEDDVEITDDQQGVMHLYPGTL